MACHVPKQGVMFVDVLLMRLRLHAELEACLRKLCFGQGRSGPEEPQTHQPKQRL